MERCLQFNSSGQTYVTALNAITSYPFTFEAWVKFESIVNGHSLISICSSDNLFISYSIFQSYGNFFISAQNPISYFRTGSTDVRKDTWYHVAGVFESNTVRKLYVNGLLEATLIDDVSYNNSAYNRVVLGVDRLINPSSYLDGKLSDVRIWNTARTTQEILDNRFNRLVGNELGLVGYWKLNNNSTIAVDSSSSNLVGTLVNNPIWVNEISLDLDLPFKNDWTSTDKLNFSDMNRIEGNVDSVVKHIQNISCETANYTHVTNRTSSGIDYLSSINRLENNINQLKVDLKATLNFLPKKDWELGTILLSDDVNRWESNINLVKKTVNTIFESYIFCGEINSGQIGELI